MSQASSLECPDAFLIQDSAKLNAKSSRKEIQNPDEKSAYKNGSRRGFRQEKRRVTRTRGTQFVFSIWVSF